jgi:hypothetical protein
MQARAAVAVFWQRPVDDIPLKEVARRAGVSVQTVIRRFGASRACSPRPPSGRPNGSAASGTRRPSATCRESYAT